MEISHYTVNGDTVGPGFEPHQCLLVHMWKRVAGVTPEVNLKELLTHTPPPSVNKAAHSGFQTQRRCHQKSKTGVSAAPQKGLMSFKNLIKTRMHSSRMRTARSLTIKVGGGCLPRGGSVGGGVRPVGVCPRGVLCNLSHNAFDVTCILS